MGLRRRGSFNLSTRGLRALPRMRLRVSPGRAIVGINEFAVERLRSCMRLSERFLEIAHLPCFTMDGLSYTSPTTTQSTPSHRRTLSNFGTCPISRRSDAKVGQQVERLARPGSQTLTRPDLDATCHAFERDNRRATRWAWRVTGLNPIAPTLIPLLAMLPRASTRFRRRNTKLRGSRPTPSVTTTGREGRDERQKVVNGGMPVRLPCQAASPWPFSASSRPGHSRHLKPGEDRGWGS
jgi:hypothetical protein